VPDERTHHVTQLLIDWTRGDETALQRLLPVVHDELRQLARRQMAGERPGHMLQATALVNEAYLKLVDLRKMQWQDRAHFFAMASRLMRRILVDAARARSYQKRGSGVPHATFDEAMNVGLDQPKVLVALDDALDALSEVNERQSRVVEMRFFGGLNIEETAAVLKVSPETVKRDWKAARTWLMRELGPVSESPDRPSE
jgi:RNA polymerase sigma factor (TIGR02999 family)